ncbi:hypothetical protein LY76DRAFT_228155 [Colletotrichum caudatum]|nr:hypothetical protein LY76DRAFT_228155 [Colletotrichum caudatum]
MDRALMGWAPASRIIYFVLDVKGYGMMREGVRQPSTPLPMCLLNKEVITHPRTPGACDRETHYGDCDDPPPRAIAIRRRYRALFITQITLCLLGLLIGYSIVAFSRGVPASRLTSLSLSKRTRALPARCGANVAGQGSGRQTQGFSEQPVLFLVTET